MSVKEWETAYVEARGRVAWVWINRPKAMNALNLQLMYDLDAAFQMIEGSDDFDVVVLTGVGEKAFCGGGDLKMIHEYTRDPEGAYRMLSQMMRLVWSLKSMSKPVVARVNGVAIGGAGELLMPCDIIIAADKAKFMLGETSAGAVPFVGTTQWLGLSVGDKRAKYAMLTDELFSAQTAQEWGLVNKVVPLDKLDEEVEKVTNLLADRAPWAMRLIKTQANAYQDLTLNSIMAGRESWTLLTLVPDLMKSCQAFMNRKTPDWAGMRAEQLEKGTAYYYWGPMTKSCEKCGTDNLPENMRYCGLCGESL
jgi:enoyl-CoA hydratase/carnithine racemase